MIDTSVEILRDELVQYLKVNGYALADTLVIIENIALLDTNNITNLDNSIVFTVVNIEEAAAPAGADAASHDGHGEMRRAS